MKVVLDTNVLVSALINANGIPARILAQILNGKLKIAYDNRIIFEYFDVLSRKEFGFDSETIQSLINYVRMEGEYINADLSGEHFTDEADKKFYEVYLSSEAQYLITGNGKHFPQENTIIAPRELLEKI